MEFRLILGLISILVQFGVQFRFNSINMRKVGNATLRMCYPNIVTLQGWLESTLNAFVRDIMDDIMDNSGGSAKAQDEGGKEVLIDVLEVPKTRTSAILVRSSTVTSGKSNGIECTPLKRSSTLPNRLPNRPLNPYAINKQRSSQEATGDLLKNLKIALRTLHTISSSPAHPLHDILSNFLLSPPPASAAPPPPSKHFGKKYNPLHVIVDATVSHHVLTGHKNARKKAEREKVFVRQTEGRDVMALGYSYSKETLTTTSSLQSSTLTPGMTNIHLNSSVHYFKSASTRRLHDLIGDEWLTFLMRKCSCFAKCAAEPVPGDDSDSRCYFQLCGEPIFGAVKRLESTVNPVGPKVNETEKRKETVIPRFRILYSQSFVKNVGLPKNNLLNILVKSPEKGFGDDEVKVLTARVLKIGNLKEDDVFKVLGNKKVPKVDSKIGRICRDVLRRYKRMDICRIFEATCPIRRKGASKKASKAKVTEADLNGFDFKTLIDMYTPHDAVIQFITRCFLELFPSSLFGSSGNVNIVTEGLEKFCTIRLKENIAESELLRGFKLKEVEWLYNKGEGPVSRDCAVSRQNKMLNVLTFVYNIFIIPLIRSTFYVTETQFGGNSVFYYRKRVWKQIRKLSFETFNTRYDVLEGQEVAERLGRGKMGAAELRLVPKEKSVRGITMLQKRRFIDGIDGKIKAKGEIVKSGGGGGGKKQKVTAEGMVGGGGSDVTAAKGNGSGAAATAAVVGKPDATVNNKSFQTAKFKSTNNILQNSFQILKYEVERREKCFGSGIHISDMFSKVLEFKNRLISASKDGKTLPKLYWASSDIQSCFDNISQKHIFSLLQSLLDEDDYCISKYAVCHPYESRGKCNVKHVKSVSNDVVRFGDKAKSLAGNYTESVFVDGVTVSVEHKDRLIELLKEHVFDNVVVARDGVGREKFLVQKEGIAQGSVLSTLLCNVYFGDVEDKLLKGVFKGEDGELNLLVRVVDDFLLVSTKKQVAVDFLKRMTAGIEELGVIVNKSKTTVSFKTEEAGRCVEGEDFPFCGLLFNTETCEARYEYERFNGSKAVDDLTVEVAVQPGITMGIKSKTFVRPRCSEITLDSRLNGREQILDNLYQMFLLGGIKMNAYGRILEERRGKGKGTGGGGGEAEGAGEFEVFEVKQLDELITYAYALIQKRISQAGGLCSIKSEELKALGWRAFEEVYRRSKREGVAALLKEKVRLEGLGGGGGGGGGCSFLSRELKEAARRGLDKFNLNEFTY